MRLMARSGRNQAEAADCLIGESVVSWRRGQFTAEEAGYRISVIRRVAESVGERGDIANTRFAGSSTEAYTG